jgi:hypothetical protein
MSRAVALALSLVLLAAAPAAAQHSAVANPDLARAGTHLTVSLDGTQPEIGGRVPRGLILSSQRGYRFDGKAVKGRCEREQAQSSACPDDSRIGTGFADVTASSPLFGSFDVRAEINTYLAPREKKTELAGVIATLTVLGTQTVARGYVDSPRTGAYGLRVVFDQLPETPAQGFTVTLKRFETSFGAERTIVRRKKVHGKKRRVKEKHVMLRNPKACARASWLGRAILRFEDGSIVTIDSPIACRPRT